MARTYKRDAKGKFSRVSAARSDRKKRKGEFAKRKAASKKAGVRGRHYLNGKPIPVEVINPWTGQRTKTNFNPTVKKRKAHKAARKRDSAKRKASRKRSKR